MSNYILFGWGRVDRDYWWVAKAIGESAPKDFIQWHLTITDKLLLFKPVTSVTLTEFEESFAPPLPLPAHSTIGW
jgi:hypothetical protein